MLENVSLEEGVEDRMMTLEKVLVRQLCEDGRLTELTVDRKRRWVLTLAALNSRVSLAESWGVVLHRPRFRPQPAEQSA